MKLADVACFSVLLLDGFGLQDSLHRLWFTGSLTSTGGDDAAVHPSRHHHGLLLHHDGRHHLEEEGDRRGRRKLPGENATGSKKEIQYAIFIESRQMNTV
jgi:hypothetical protein